MLCSPCFLILWLCVVFVLIVSLWLSRVVCCELSVQCWLCAYVCCVRVCVSRRKRRWRCVVLCLPHCVPQCLDNGDIIRMCCRVLSLACCGNMCCLCCVVSPSFSFVSCLRGIIWVVLISSAASWNLVVLLCGSVALNLLIAQLYRHI